MRIYITGATGFVGRYVVEESLRRGHDVTAVVRPGSAGAVDGSAVTGHGEGADEGTTDAVDGSPEAAVDGGPISARRGSVREVRVDLRSRHGLAESLQGADVVIHLAAAKAGDFYTQFAGTVVATENLLAAMDQAGVTKLVGISTFSVYDYLHIKPGTLLDERSPIDTTPNLRDEYARTKLLQEKLYRRFGEADRTRHVIIRPGMIYGPDHLWHALLGADIGTRFLRIGSKAVLPMAYVENCAEAIVLAAEKLVDETSPGGPDDIDGAVINIVDDDLPTQQVYAELVSSRMETPPSIRVPWAALRTAAGLLKKGNQVALAGRAKFPGIAVPDRLHARFKPLRYTNRRAKELLGWTPRHDLLTAIDRSVAEQQRRKAAQAAERSVGAGRSG